MPKLLDQVRTTIRVRHFGIRTEQAYLRWVKEFILFHNKRHLSDIGQLEVTAFLSHLALDRNVAASTQNQAMSAILFLYRDILKQPMASLLYGSGLRLMECLRLRVKDLDFSLSQVIVRGGKGGRDRVTILPDSVRPPPQRHLAKVKALHKLDLDEGYGEVYLPFALERKYRNANREWHWPYVFPASKRSVDPRSQAVRRHHANEQMLQKAVKAAIRAAGISQPGSCHTFRHNFATHLLEDGYDIREAVRYFDGPVAPPLISPLSF